MIWEDVSAAIRGGTFEARSDRHLSRSVLELDEAGWKELSELLSGTLEEAEKIESRSASGSRRARGTTGSRCPSASC